MKAASFASVALEISRSGADGLQQVGAFAADVGQEPVLEATHGRDRDAVDTAAHAGESDTTRPSIGSGWYCGCF